MFVMFDESFFCELLFRGSEYRFAESFDSEFSYERQSCRCEEHLLAHGSCIWDVGDGDERGGVAGWVAPEDYVERGFVFEVRGEEIEVGVEGGGCGLEDGGGSKRFFGYSAEEPALRFIGYE
jgi:hypothetical protein